jgi:TRAP-type C4-dicarboxylate transport system permease small subunit
MLQHQRSAALDLPVYYVYAALPLVSLLMALVVVYQMVARLSGARDPGHDIVNLPPSLDPDNTASHSVLSP